jgi:D-glycero-D-manno-heptose 1,7-bisphosphate phosphatase
MPLKLLILDRDGVINEDSDAFVKSVDEWIPIPGSLDAIARLTQAGYRIAIATNQSGLARGLLTQGDLDAMHQRLHAWLSEHGGHVDAIFFCPHGPNDHCNCRKPRPGLLLAAQDRLGVSPGEALVVGDSLRDIEAAHAAGMAAALVKTGKGSVTLATAAHRLLGASVYPNLAAVADHLLGD